MPNPVPELVIVPVLEMGPATVMPPMLLALKVRFCDAAAIPPVRVKRPAPVLLKLLSVPEGVTALVIVSGEFPPAEHW